MMKRLNVMTLFGIVLIILAIIGFIVHILKEPESLNEFGKEESPVALDYPNVDVELQSAIEIFLFE